MMRSQRAFTLVELLIVMAVAALLLTLAAPSFFDFILVQRLKGVSAQLTTDLQLARGEAAARRDFVRVRFSKNTTRTCYVIFTGAAGSCNCVNSPVCANPASEIRTVDLPRSLGVAIEVPAIAGFTMLQELAFDHATGGVVIAAGDFRDSDPPRITIDARIEGSRALRTEISLSGRPSTCSVAGSITGAPAC